MKKVREMRKLEKRKGIVRSSRRRQRKKAVLW